MRYIGMDLNIYVPTDLNEITLGQYQSFVSFQKTTEDEGRIAQKMLEIFCGLKTTEAIKVRYKDANAIIEILIDLMNNKPSLIRRFKMKGQEYGFIPNLDEMSLGEYVDLDTFIGDTDNLHRAMAVLFRPVQNKYGNQYNIEDYTGEGTELMKDMPLDVAFGAMLFFYRLGMDLSEAMMNYLQEEEQSSLIQHLSLAESGDGINQFTHLLKEILQDLKISLN
jgi:hypothetical protein